MSATLISALACVVLASSVHAAQFPVQKFQMCSGDPFGPAPPAGDELCSARRETWCLVAKGSCRKCSDCTPCGRFNSAVCSRSKITGTKCSSNFVELPAPPGQPPRCGCAPGTKRVDNKCINIDTPTPVSISVAPYARCPINKCTGRDSFCTRPTACKLCTDCVRCGDFGAQPCPFKLLSSGNFCKLNYRVLQPTKNKPYSSCGCPAGTVHDPFTEKCVKASPRPRPPSEEPIERFFANKFDECPTACDGRQSFCTVRKTCRKCDHCSPCGIFGVQPCARTLVHSGHKCNSNYVVLPPTSPEGKPYCGCRSGSVRVGNKCKFAPRPPRMAPPPVSSPPPIASPPPVYPPVNGFRVLVDSASDTADAALGMSAVRETLLPVTFRTTEPFTPFTVDAEAPVRTLRFEECPSGCGSRTAYCTHSDACDSCTTCTLCGLPGGLPCPLEAFTSGAQCLNNLEIVAPTEETPRHTCGCRLPNMLDPDTNTCTLHA